MFLFSFFAASFKYNKESSCWTSQTILHGGGTPEINSATPRRPLTLNVGQRQIKLDWPGDLLLPSFHNWLEVLGAPWMFLHQEKRHVWSYLRLETTCYKSYLLNSSSPFLLILRYMCMPRQMHKRELEREKEWIKRYYCIIMLAGLMRCPIWQSTCFAKTRTWVQFQKSC